MDDKTAERFNILIVDDAPDNIEILNELLEKEYKVFFATSGTEVLALSASTLPDLILLDIVMPELDGYDVCRALERKNAEREQALEQNRMLVREVFHRVKNNLNVACSLLNLQKELVKDSRDASLFVEARNRIQVMSGIHELLCRSFTLTNVPAVDFFTTITHKLICSYDRREIHPRQVRQSRSGPRHLTGAATGRNAGGEAGRRSDLHHPVPDGLTFASWMQISMITLNNRSVLNP